MTTEPEPVDIIEDLEDLEWLAGRLGGVRRVAVDLESDSFYTYYPKVCLVQLTFGEEDYIVDPLAAKDMSPLGPMFRDPSIEKVFHAAEYDVQLLKRDYGFAVRTIFDTMAAARVLGCRELGLAALIHARFGVKLSKKLQRADWGQRPLTPAQIEYARRDTHYLLTLRDLLAKDLEAKGRLPDAEEEFRRLEEVEPVERVFDPQAFWRLPGARQLEPRCLPVLKELFFFREKTASELDRAPFRVLPEPLLVRLAEQVPADAGALERVHGMTPYLFRRFGGDLLEAVARGLRQPPVGPPPARPDAKPLDAGTMQRYQALREWRKQKAAELAVDPVVVLPTESLRDLARAPASGGSPSEWLDGLSARRRELYGEELLRLLSVEVKRSVRRPRRR